MGKILKIIITYLFQFFRKFFVLCLKELENFITVLKKELVEQLICNTKNLLTMNGRSLKQNYLVSGLLVQIENAPV